MRIFWFAYLMIGVYVLAVCLKDEEMWLGLRATSYHMNRHRRSLGKHPLPDIVFGLMMVIAFAVTVLCWPVALIRSFRD